MPARRATDEAILAAYRDAGSTKGAARALGMAKSSVQERLSRLRERVQRNDSELAFASRKGLLGTLPVLPSFEIKRTTVRYDKHGKVAGEYVTQAQAPGAEFQVPEGHVVKGESAWVDADGRVRGKWVKTREGRSPERTFEELREALAGLQDYRAAPVPAPAECAEELARVYVAADWHLGLMTWAGETGKNWDLKLAQAAIGGAIERLVAASPPSKQAVVLGLGDLLHADGLDNCTPKSKHVLDVDGRYPKIALAATRQIVQTAKAALAKHDQVLIRILRGNHDEESAANVAIAVAFHFEDDPRVSVDLDFSPYWWWSWGTTFLGATHGDGAKMKDLPLIMAAWNPEAWGRSVFRHILTGHIHTQTGIEVAGVTVESFQTPAPADAWHVGRGYRANRSLTSITYHRADGEVSRNKVNIV